MLDKVKSFIFSLLENSNISVNNETTKRNRELLKVRDSEENFKEVLETVNINVPKEDWKYLDLGSLILDWSSTTNEPDEEYLWGGFKIHSYSSALRTPSHFWDNYNDDSRFWENNPQPEAEAVWKDFLPKLNYFHKSSPAAQSLRLCAIS
ncbi:hypothetical protein [Chryseobacterium formosus]|nr:hypothetical protein [Chryseobacterium formosus]